MNASDDLDTDTDPAERARRAMLRIEAPATSLQRWTTNDGRSVRVCEMSDRHLMNLIRLVERQKAAPAERTGPGSARKKVEREGLWPILLNERDRRGLGDFKPPGDGLRKCPHGFRYHCADCDLARALVTLAALPIDYSFNPWDE